jgi:oxygen-dependent protoporphyrinogen oxidase
LAKALAEKVGGESLQLNSVVIGLASNQQGNPLRNNWTVSYLKGGSSKKEQKNFDAVILTTPFHEMQQLGVMKDGQKYPLDYFPEVSSLTSRAYLLSMLDMRTVRWLRMDAESLG